MEHGICVKPVRVTKDSEESFPSQVGCVCPAPVCLVRERERHSPPSQPASNKAGASSSPDVVGSLTNMHQSTP